jgi:hypothetical protein
MIAGEVILSQLHGGVRLPSGSRIFQSDRLHRPEPERVLTAMRHHFDRQASLEKLFFVEIMHGRRLGRRERRVERAILVCRHRAVQVIARSVIGSARLARRLQALSFWLWAAPIPSGGSEYLRHVDRF